MRRTALVTQALFLAVWSSLALADASNNELAERAATAGSVLDARQIVAAARPSIAVVSVKNREGGELGVGTGFVVGADGLIATNLHVIGEARPIWVRLADGRSFEVRSVHASDRALDLAVIRVDANDLKPLPLGDSDTLRQGQAFVALGNPFGLAHSAVEGIVSAVRPVEGRPYIQMAVPVEPGNSGGPVLNAQGHVQGIVTLKSMFEVNVGFAVPINQLKPLLKNPNPIPMSRWLTIGAIDADVWESHFGGSWRQRAGRIIAEGPGSGFGGRTMLLARSAPPKRPFEAAVSVRLDDESGAAGLAFCADDQRHYGFYVSAERMRLTRFDGPHLHQWHILEQVRSPHYRAGEWNTLKVRLGPGRIECFVNDEPAIESADEGLSDGRIGLVKFRQTRVQFRRFQTGSKLPAQGVPAGVAEQIANLSEPWRPDAGDDEPLIEALLPYGPAARRVLAARARAFEQRADQLRRLAAAVHHKSLQSQLVNILNERDPDVFHAALLIAKMDNHEVDVDAYRAELQRMVDEVAKRLPAPCDDQARLATLNTYLFDENGFHGSRTDYYNRSNSYMNEVFDDREGLPITLSVLYMTMGRRIGLDLVGAGLPGHFMIRHLPRGAAHDAPLTLIDVFDAGKKMTRQEADRMVMVHTGRNLKDADLAPASPTSIVVRMFKNLWRVAQGNDPDDGLHYLDAILAIDPNSAEHRALRALMHARTGRRRAAFIDIDWLFEHRPPGVDLDRVREMRKALEQAGD